MRDTFIQVLNDLARHDDRVYLVSGDAGYGVFESFRAERPERFINAGVAEANMIGYASGMAMAGFNVFVYNIVPFVLYRCFEQVRNDMCYQRLPVTLVGTGAGLTYAPGGMTHYSVEDLALCAALPNLTVISPMDPVETAAAIRYAYIAEGPVYIRLAKSGEPVLREDGCPDVTKAVVVRPGEDVAVVTYGSIFHEAVTAADVLAEKGIRLRIISVPTINPFPEKDLVELLAGCRHVITLEEHFRSGGLATRMMDVILSRGLNIHFIPLALPDAFIHDVRHQAGMRKEYGLDADGLVSTVLENLGPARQ